jgi:flagellar biosynthetic protein FliR
MSVDIDPGWAQSVFLVAIRLGVLFLMSPLFAGLGGLVTVRVLLTLALSACLAAGAGFAAAPLAPGLAPLLLAALGELAVGAILAFGVFAAFGAFSVAGKLLDVQSGFGIGSVYDPVTRGGAPLFASILNMVGVVTFFSLDGHHALMRGIAFSLRQVPPGAGLGAIPAEAAIAQFGLMFSLGVALAIPVILCLLLLDVGLAVVSRVLPQMNVFIVLAPVKIIAALALFALSVSALGPPMAKVFLSIFTYWEGVLR